MKRIFLFLLFLCLVFNTNVVKADTSAWQQFGEPVSEHATGATSIVIDSNNIIYIAYSFYGSSDTSGLNGTRIEKYDDGVWSSLGEFHENIYSDTFQLKLNSEDQLYLAYEAEDSSETSAIFVEKYTGSSWQNVGGLGSTGMLLSGDKPEGSLIFEIGPDDTLYVAYNDFAITNNVDSVGRVLKIFEYTGNFITDNDGKQDDGWEYAFNNDIALIDVLNYDIENYNFSVGSDNEAYLALSKNMGAVSPPDYKLFSYKYDDAWVSLSDDPFDLTGEFFLKAGQNEAYLYIGEVVDGFTEHSIKRYSDSTESWSAITSDEEFLNDGLNFTYFYPGTPFTFDANGDLNFVYGNADTTSWDSPWGSATVVKYTGSAWEYVGDKRFSESSSMYFSIAAGDDDLYVICRDDGDNDGKAVVYKFGSTESGSDTSGNSDSQNIADDSGEVGFSPVTGEEEAISVVDEGQYIRSYSFNSIYYLDENFVRHPFWDANSFFTYADSFNEVVWVTDATLSTMTLGTPMLPNPGVVLVKIQSNPKVFAIDGDNVLRWVPDEATALSLYGSDWSNYVIDLEPTAFARYSIGEDMDQNESVSTNEMKTRTELVESAQ